MWDHPATMTATPEIRDEVGAFDFTTGRLRDALLVLLPSALPTEANVVVFACSGEDARRFFVCQRCTIRVYNHKLVIHPTIISPAFSTHVLLLSYSILPLVEQPTIRDCETSGRAQALNLRQVVQNAWSKARSSTSSRRTRRGCHRLSYAGGFLPLTACVYLEPAS